MPVFLFAVVVAERLDITHLVAVFIVLHLLVYPASNGYNSYIDRDTTPIGGLKEPPMPERNLFWLTIVMDVVALLVAVYISYVFTVLLFSYILASRLYSGRYLRLKGKPILGFLTVVVFQGAVSFSMVYIAVSDMSFLQLFEHHAGYICSTLLVGGTYPLTQIYQHEEDRESGDITLSILLGYKGTFVFSIIMLSAAAVAMYFELSKVGFSYFYLIFIICLLPVLVYFLLWMKAVWRNTSYADHKHTMRMNVIASACMNTAFLVMILIKHIL